MPSFTNASLRKDKIAKTFYETSDIWGNYLKNKTIDERNKIVEYYLPLVKKVVSVVKWERPPHIDKEDLYGMGCLALLTAVEKFDPRRTKKVRGHLRTKIELGIYDELRSLDWVPNRVKYDLKKVRRLQEDCYKKEGRHLTENELASVSGFSPSRLEYLKDRANTFVDSFDALPDVGLSYSQTEAASSHVSSLQILEDRELLTYETSSLNYVLATLPEKNRIALLLRTLGLTHAEVGIQLGISSYSAGVTLKETDRLITRRIERVEEVLIWLTLNLSRPVKGFGILK